MTEQTKAVAKKTPGSMLERLLAVAKTPEERAKAYDIAERHQQNQLVQELVAEVKARSWGNRVSPALRAGIVRWALEIGADPVDELDILGGGPYLNARYWMRLCAAEPDFLRAEEVWVHDDPRADEETAAKRTALRVQYAIPDQIDGNLGRSASDRKANAAPVPVKAAVLVYGHFQGRGPFIGKKWSPSRANDDVGMDFPEASALTRAWRKMALQAVRQQPRVSAKLKALAAAQRHADEVGATVEPSGAGIADTTGGTQALGAGMAEAASREPDPYTGQEPATSGTCQHAPSAICDRGDRHDVNECGYTKPKLEA